MHGTEQQAVPLLVSGVGPITRLGLGLDELAEGIAELTVLQEAGSRSRAPEQAVWTVPPFDLEDFVEGCPADAKLHVRCAAAAAALALENAAVLSDEVDPARCGLSLATVFGRSGAGGAAGGPAPWLRGACFESASAVLSDEFALHGCHRSFCGDFLSGAQALEAAVLALRSGRADLMLTGGVDCPDAHLLERLSGEAAPPGLRYAQGAALLVLETQNSVERREGYAYCELGSVVCRGTGGRRSARACAGALQEAVRQAMQEADVWEGDVGVVLSSGGGFHARAAQGERRFLEGFSQVPSYSTKAFV
ncbi:MAG: beta-ketoacyl synthase N-terminal-like domain-containing protein, partial [Planctomycetota bacterium]